MSSTYGARVLLVSGKPGIGKTTILLKCVKELREKNLKVGGIISKEVRSGSSRIGFEIIDLNSNARGWLAQIGRNAGPHIGKYSVNLEDLETIGVAAIEGAILNSDVVGIDEVGPMELLSRKFRESVTKAVQSGKLLIAVIHVRSTDRLIDDLMKREDARLYSVTTENRDRLHGLIVKDALESLNAKSPTLNEGKPS